MANYKRILVATDLHNECLPILRAGVELAKQHKAELSVVSVVPNVPYYMASGLSSISDIEDQLETEVRDRLTKAQSELATEAKFYLKHGSAKVEIVKMAEKLDADLIVIGSHGHRGVQRLLGSTASGVLHRAKCDVLVIRAKV